MADKGTLPWRPRYLHCVVSYADLTWAPLLPLRLGLLGRGCYGPIKTIVHTSAGDRTIDTALLGVRNHYARINWPVVSHDSVGIPLSYSGADDCICRLTASAYIYHFR